MHSYSSSEEDLKSTPEYGSDSEKGKRSLCLLVLFVVVSIRLLLPFKQFYLLMMMVVMVTWVKNREVSNLKILQGLLFCAAEFFLGLKMSFFSHW